MFRDYALCSLTRWYSLQKLKFQKIESHSTRSFLKKELEDGYLRSILSDSSSVVSSSKMAPDPLLSFLYNVPSVDKSESVQPGCSTEVTSQEKNTDEKMLERLVVWLCFMTFFLCVLMHAS